MTCALPTSRRNRQVVVTFRTRAIAEPGVWVVSIVLNGGDCDVEDATQTGASGDVVSATGIRNQLLCAAGRSGSGMKMRIRMPLARTCNVC